MYLFDPARSTTEVFKVGTHGITTSGVSGNTKDVAPRVGFSYKVGPKTVVHGGYGVYYEAPAPGCQLLHTCSKRTRHRLLGVQQPNV